MNSEKKPMRFLRWPEIARRSGLGQTRIYELEKQGRFPKRIKISDRAVAWLESEIDEWLEARAATAVKGENYQETAAMDLKASQRSADTESLSANQDESSKSAGANRLPLMSVARGPMPSIVIGDAGYLKALSGYEQKSAVANWCGKNGIKFFINAQGWPVTTETALNSALSGGNAGPDWSAFDDWKTGTHWRHRRRRQEMGIPEPTVEPNTSKATIAGRKRSKNM